MLPVSNNEGQAIAIKYFLFPFLIKSSFIEELFYNLHPLSDLLAKELC
jgi:hypothetical protein